MKTYYENITHSDTLDPGLPCYSQYTPLATTTLHTIRYTRQLYDNKLVFHAKSDNGIDVCVKFVTQYSQQTHQHCVELGIAPELLGFETLPGGWFMVVMAWIDKGYQSLDKIEKTDRSFALRERIREKLSELHRRGYVHGDIRDTNVMMDSTSRHGFLLIDFDWSGEIGKTFYPMNVNRQIPRPEDAKDGNPILADHRTPAMPLRWNSLVPCPIIIPTKRSAKLNSCDSLGNMASTFHPPKSMVQSTRPMQICVAAASSFPL